MLTQNINLKNFLPKKLNKKIKKELKFILSENNELINSLSKSYKDEYDIRKIKKIVGKNDLRLIGMGGSILGAQSIYNFLKNKIKKKFIFVDNLVSKQKKKDKQISNLIISKSGNTLETIINANILIKKKQKNIFITENKSSYIFNLAHNLKDEVIRHNNFIGGRYAVLSEVGMLPAELMGLNSEKFRQLNNLIKNKKFLNSLILNTSSILHFVKKKKFNSVIVNYDQNANYLFKWYQQLIAESLGKKGKGILPIISEMPKDNHSVMQLYLDGLKNNFFTFFYCKDYQSNKINKNQLLSSHKYLKSFNVDQVIFKQKIATENIFRKKKIPFRSFELNTRDEKTLGELFCYFILETILLGKALNLNPFDQPAVELIKKETKNLLFQK